MKEKLKPCPFCGCEMVEKVKAPMNGYYFIQCDSCHARSDISTVKQVVEDWNRRANK